MHQFPPYSKSFNLDCRRPDRCFQCTVLEFHCLFSERERVHFRKRFKYSGHGKCDDIRGTPSLARSLRVEARARDSEGDKEGAAPTLLLSVSFPETNAIKASMFKAYPLH